MRSTSARRAACWAAPPARRIAPSTPPPPISPLLAALTTASTSCSTMSPATIVISTGRSLSPMGTVTVRAYGEGDKTREGASLDEVSDLLALRGATVWVDLDDPSPTDMEVLAAELGLHHLAVEDALERHQRDKYVHYDDHLFLVCHAVQLDVEPAELRTDEVDAFIGDRWFVTVHKGPARPARAGECPLDPRTGTRQARGRLPAVRPARRRPRRLQRHDRRLRAVLRREGGPSVRRRPARAGRTAAVVHDAPSR